MFDSEIAADNPDLQAFKAHGGKLIMWQGLADQLIFTGDSINYYTRAVAANGGISSTESFFRYFLAPGVGVPPEVGPTHGPGRVLRTPGRGRWLAGDAHDGQVAPDPAGEVTRYHWLLPWLMRPCRL
jgi:Tannase and feruloyl esterase